MLIAISSILLILRDWTTIKYVEEQSLLTSQIYWLAKLPGFDDDTFPFCISHGSPTFNVINVKEGYNDVLVKAPEKHYYGQQAAVFKSVSESDKEDEHYPYPVSMHFATRLISEEGKRTTNWHCLQFKRDFKETL